MLYRYNLLLFFLVLFSAALIFGERDALSYDSVLTGKVTLLEPSYMPNWFLFQMDQGTDACPVGTFLGWDGKYHDVDGLSANTRTAYAQMAASMLSQKKVTIYVINDYNGNHCYVQHIHALNE